MLKDQQECKYSRFQLKKVLFLVGYTKPLKNSPSLKRNNILVYNQLFQSSHSRFLINEITMITIIRFSCECHFQAEADR